MRSDLLKRLFSLFLLAAPALLQADANEGYYRFPTIHGDTVVFTSEGDLWKVDAAGGTARRLTTHPGTEIHPALSPDGKSVAFSADYEGPLEVYVMPVEGGLPQRLTWDGERARVEGWTPGGEVLYATWHFSTLPNFQLVRIDPVSRARRLLPLHQAAEGAYDPTGETLFFTRFNRQGSKTKRYHGGTAQNLWRFTESQGEEAVALTADYTGTSHHPMVHKGRVYFVSDRDGTMNLYSMTTAGTELRQHTHYFGWDVKTPDLGNGRIVYQLGADLHVLDLASEEARQLAIGLASDFDQTREKWVEKPIDYLSAAHLSPDGDRVALTARGQVFVAPVEDGRFVRVTRDGYRHRNARFLPDGDELVVLSDESGEVELHRLDPRGVEPGEPITTGGDVLRFAVYPSPDGKWAAYVEKDDELWIADLATGERTQVAVSQFFGFGSLNWSPDGRWLAYAVPTENFLSQIQLYNVASGETTAVTSDRFNSDNPAWSADGRFLYFLSQRHLVSLSSGPWGNYQPSPLLDATTKIYEVALQSGERSPFASENELTGKDDEDKDEDKDDEEEKSDKEKKDELPDVEIDLEGIQTRLVEVPVPPGNYFGLGVGQDELYWLSTTVTARQKVSLAAIEREPKAKVKTLTNDLEWYEISASRKKILLRQDASLYVVDAKAAPLKDLGEHRVGLDGWTLSLDPRREWRQMFVDAWRLQRDYFYDPGMHGVDWPAVLDKYLPLVERVRERSELSDLFGEMIGELSTLHEFVYGGDQRGGDDDVDPASLGAVLERDEAAGGYRVTRVYPSDPDMPEERAPLSRPGVEVVAGEVIVAINGVETLSVDDPRSLLRQQAGRQVLLKVQEANGKEREVIVEPFASRDAAELRYDSWELERRQLVEEQGGGDIGYVHMRAMGGGNYTEWARHYYPVFHRKGLVIDMRHNRGGNIDSWILATLIRRPWMWWKARTGIPYSNMQFAFNGHMVVLCDESTASDGEAFTEGFRRLDLGKVIGTRTWGGEVWLTSSNGLVDRGIATAAEFGVYGPEGEWLIEGHGVEPDIVVDNLPYATFGGHDAQLEAAIEYLQEKIRDEPPVVPEPPEYPDKSFPQGGASNGG
jgi:tricorn protease